jgi:hypothetical protein
MGQSQAIALPLINSPPMPHRPAQVFDPAPDQMKTTAEAADVIPLGASFPSLAMGMGNGRARCFRQGLPCPANPKAPRITPEALAFLEPVPSPMVVVSSVSAQNSASTPSVVRGFPS